MTTNLDLLLNDMLPSVHMLLTQNYFLAALGAAQVFAGEVAAGVRTQVRMCCQR